jgi:putative redox protein
MKRHEVVTSWAGGLAFDAQVSGHRLRMDASAEAGGEDSGCRPKPLLLAAVAGCTGMDVVSILKKMREPLSWFDIAVGGELTEGEPSYYGAMEIVYRFKASDGLDPAKVEKAVSLSQERYCGVSAQFKLSIPVSHRIEYL